MPDHPPPLPSPLSATFSFSPLTAKQAEKCTSSLDHHKGLKVIRGWSDGICLAATLMTPTPYSSAALAKSPMAVTTSRAAHTPYGSTGYKSARQILGSKLQAKNLHTAQGGMNKKHHTVKKRVRLLKAGNSEVMPASLSLVRHKHWW